MKTNDSYPPKEKPEVSEDENDGRHISRRSLLATGAAAMAVPLFVPRRILGGPGYQAPSDSLRIAAVGLHMGGYYLNGCEDENIVALCDLDHNTRMAANCFKKWPKASRYHDFRKMLDNEANNIDALIVATPDHTHTIILMAAIGLNKHIYCAKPITHNIGEARRVRKALLESKHLVTKSSAQSSGTDGARNSTELLRTGVIGPVTEVHISCSHPTYPTNLTRPTEAQTPPPGMDWDKWIGPAPYREFHSAYHPWYWRPWWDFGNGAVGDMCCHTLHFYFQELKLRAPTAIYGTGSTRWAHETQRWMIRIETPECCGSANMITWEFPAREDLPPLNVHWYDGGLKPHRPTELDKSLPMPEGVLFVGEKGKLLTGFGGGSPYKDRGNSGGLLLPEERFSGFQDPPKTMRRADDHYKDWTQACKTGGETVCSVEYGCELTELGLLGALALRTGKLLEWDSERMRFTNQGDDVNILVDPPYRKGWEI